ncbi:unnamed protein product, partial [Nesidiocoris tenuis]
PDEDNTLIESSAKGTLRYPIFNLKNLVELQKSAKQKLEKVENSALVLEYVTRNTRRFNYPMQSNYVLVVAERGEAGSSGQAGGTMAAVERREREDLSMQNSRLMQKVPTTERNIQEPPRPNPVLPMATGRDPFPALLPPPQPRSVRDSSPPARSTLGSHPIMIRFSRYPWFTAHSPTVNGMTKLKMGAQHAEQTSSNYEFIERRKSALERYLQRTADHPVLGLDAEFRDFLQNEPVVSVASCFCLICWIVLIPVFRDLATFSGALARTVAMISNCEEHRLLALALVHLNGILEKNVFHERVKVYQNWQHSQLMLNKKREYKAKMDLANRSDKGNFASNEIVEDPVLNNLSNQQILDTLEVWKADKTKILVSSDVVFCQMEFTNSANLLISWNLNSIEKLIKRLRSLSDHSLRAGSPVPVYLFCERNDLPSLLFIEDVLLGVKGIEFSNGNLSDLKKLAIESREKLLKSKYCSDFLSLGKCQLENCNHKHVMDSKKVTELDNHGCFIKMKSVKFHSAYHVAGQIEDIVLNQTSSDTPLLGMRSRSAIIENGLSMASKKPSIPDDQKLRLAIGTVVGMKLVRNDQVVLRRAKITSCAMEEKCVEIEFLDIDLPNEKISVENIFPVPKTIQILQPDLVHVYITDLKPTCPELDWCYETTAFVKMFVKLLENKVGDTNLNWLAGPVRATVGRQLLVGSFYPCSATDQRFVPYESIKELLVNSGFFVERADSIVIPSMHCEPLVKQMSGSNLKAGASGTPAVVSSYLDPGLVYIQLVEDSDSLNDFESRLNVAMDNDERRLPFLGLDELCAVKREGSWNRAIVFLLSEPDLATISLRSRQILSSIVSKICALKYGSILCCPRTNGFGSYYLRLDVLFASDGVDSPDSCALVVHLSTNATPSHHLRRSATPDQTSVAAPARHPDHARGVTRRAGSIVIVDDADGRTTYYFVNIHRLLSCARSIKLAPVPITCWENGDWPGHLRMEASLKISIRGDVNRETGVTIFVQCLRGTRRGQFQAILRLFGQAPPPHRNG